MRKGLKIISPRPAKTVALTAAFITALTAFPMPGTAAPDKFPAPTRTPQASAPAAPKVLTPEISIKRWWISDLQLSPDGNLLAMVVAEPSGPTGQRRNIWLYNFSTHALTQFTSSARPDTRPRWSPDGRTLAFLSSRDGRNQVYLIPVDGGEAQPLTESQTGVSSFDWAPDGKKLAFETTAPPTQEEQKKERDKDDAQIVGKPDNRALLQVIDVESKALKTLVQGAWKISEYTWTPDGGSLIIMASDNPNQEVFSDKIYRVDAADGKMMLVAAPDGPFGSLQVAKEGKTLAYLGCRGSGPQAHDLFVLPLGGGPPRNLTARSIDRPVGSFIWDEAGRLFAVAATGFGNTFFTVTLEGQANKSEWTSPLLVGSYVKGKNGFAYVGESATQAAELRVAPTPGSAEKVSHFNKDWDDIKLVQPEIIRYPSFDKKQIEAALLRPEGAASLAAKPPAVILIHGGPTGAWTDRFDPWAQLLAAHGFVVLLPNIRGSTGYGYDFMVSNRFDWGGGDFKDVMAGRDWLVRQGVADSERIGIGGWSYGGYMAAWAVTQTTLFKAAVAGAPITDLAFQYGAELPFINAGDTWFMGNPYENPTLFTSRSPMTFVKNVKTPTLILCGENDPIDPVQQSYQFHRGLKRYGVEAELVVYPREGHGPREEKHRLDLLNRAVGWFEKYLK
jgi:dipeptidyl aminopeptidase/acylaminoacyl peptidase